MSPLLTEDGKRKTQNGHFPIRENTNEEMESPSVKLESLLDSIESYTKTTFELSKMKALEHIARIAPVGLSRIVVVLWFSFFGLLLSVGIALWLGDVMGKVYYGFFTVAAFYLITGLLLHAFLHKWISARVSHFILSPFTP